MRKFKALAGVVALATLSSAVPAHAVTFILNNTGGAEAGTQARFGFEVAANYWSRVLTDNVTVNLNIGFAQLGAGIIASAGSARSSIWTTDVYNALAADVLGATDAQAVATLRPLTPSVFGPGLGAVTFTANALNPAGNGYLDSSTRVDNDGGGNNATISMTKASAKALGLTTDLFGNAINYASPDASITFSNQLAFDFNPTDGIASNSFDFIGVAIHEIGHTLGFTSGVDLIDGVTSPGASATRTNAYENTITFSTLDLFRYGAPGELNWSTQGSPYFSIDGGVSQVFGESWMSTGQRNGDGRQASHFRDSPAGEPQIGVMDPTSGRGQMQEVTGTDLVAFDAVGWNFRQNTSTYGSYRYTTAAAYNSFIAGVPEPSVWLQLVLGFGVIGGTIRAHRRRTTAAFA